MTTAPTSEAELTRPPLRRATYVHVSDLTSAYNIDHALLDQELKRVKAEREEASLPKGTSNIGENEVDPSTVDTDLDVSIGPTSQKRLQPPRGGYNLCVLIGTVNIVVDKHRVDRSRVRLAEVEIGDETGTVSLRARDEQIDILQEVSERSGAVVLRNCTLELYQGKHIRLAVTKWGKLSMYPDDVASTPPPPSKMNKDRNFSLIDLSIVASEMVDIQSEGTHNSSKQSKGSSESIDTGARHVSWKIGGKTNSKQQSQSLKNRNSRDRRQSRGKSGGATPPHYGGPSSERGMIQSQLGKMRFHGHNYPRYEQSFPYVNSSQQDVLSPASAQHLLLHHQYELQHRQFHQMYTQGQQDRIHSNIQPPGMILQSTTPPGGFEYNSIGSDQHPSVIPMVGSNPILMPVGMAGTSVQPRMPPIASTLPHHDHYGSHLAGIPSSLTTCGKDGDNSVMHTQTPPIPRMEQTMQYMSVSPDDSQFSAGKMNPDAIAFAPAYMTPQGTPQIPTQSYFPAYNSSQSNSIGGAYTSSSPHANFDSQDIVYDQPSTKTNTNASMSLSDPPPKGAKLSPDCEQKKFQGESTDDRKDMK